MTLAAGLICAGLYLFFCIAGHFSRHLPSEIPVIRAFSETPGMLFAALLAVAGSLWLPHRMQELRPQAIIRASESGLNLEITGTVKSITETKSGYRAVLSGCACSSEAGEAAGFSVRLTGLTGELQPGTTLRVKGKACGFETARNDGNFDEAAWMFSEDIVCQIKKPEILSEHPPESMLYKVSWKMRLRLEEIFHAVCPDEETAGVFISLLTGDRSQLDADLKSLWQKAGIAHLLAISSLHITFAGAAAYRIVSLAGATRGVRCAVGAAAAAYFCFFTGSGVSAMRALIMFLLTMLADLTGRTYDRISALSLSFILITADRCGAIHSVSLILSYSAVAGLAFLYPLFNRRAAECKNFFVRQALDAVSAGLSVSLAMAPAQALLFYEIPVGSFFINLLILPLSSLLLASVFLTGAAGAVSFSAGSFFAASGSVLLDFFSGLGRLSLSVPGLVIITGRPENFTVLAYFLCLAAGIWLSEQTFGPGSGRKKRRKKRRMYMAGIVCFVIAVLLIPGSSVLPHIPASSVLYMLDVGQGDCLVLETPDAKVWIIDCGSTSEPDAGSGRLAPFLKIHGLRKIDGIFISHGDADHINGAQQILEDSDFQVEHLFLSDIGNRSEAETLAQKTAEAKGTAVTGLARGDSVSGNGYTFAVLSPEAGTKEENRNEESLVIRYAEEGFSVLFAGDAGEETEKTLLAAGNTGDVTVLKTGHHGSKSASSPEFLKALSPEIALISCGENNRYGHPSVQTLERMHQAGIRYFVTAENGQLTVRHEQGLVVNLKIKEIPDHGLQKR